ncbi:MAG: type II secretion system protein GspJ [Pseudomonadota bacterium]|nr:type II secretion system protein GspJ [Pseudomonadota bacterium]
MKKGFTLIEVLVAITILGALSVLTANSIGKALKDRTKVQNEIDHTSNMRDVLRIIERDINLAFNYRNIHYELLKKIKEEAKAPPVIPPNPNDPSPPNPVSPNPVAPAQEELFELKDPPPIRTHFLGEENSLYFSSLSNVRTLKDSLESDQAKIGYFIKPCQSRGGSKVKESSDCLWRKLSPYIDKDLTVGGTDTAILERVEKFELRYFGEELEGWQKEWRTDDKGKNEIRNRFPQAVQIRLTMKDKKLDSKKKYSMILVAALRYPNNTPLDGKKAKDGGTNIDDEKFTPPAADE